GDPAFFGHPEDAAEADVFRRLALPAVVIVIRRRGAEGACGGICPRSRTHHQLGGRVEALAVRIDPVRKQRLTGNPIEEGIPSAERGRIVGPTNLIEKAVARWRSANDLA